MEPSIEIDPRLQEVSDTDIVLNFSRALTALYPHMKTVYAHCYDPYDDVVEPLFHALVYCAFSAKYGISVSEQTCHRYDCVGGDYQHTNYIRVRPKLLPLLLRQGETPVELSDAFLSGRSWSSRVSETGCTTSAAER